MRLKWPVSRRLQRSLSNAREEALKKSEGKLSPAPSGASSQQAHSMRASRKARNVPEVNVGGCSNVGNDYKAPLFRRIDCNLLKKRLLTGGDSSQFSFESPTVGIPYEK